MNVTSCPISKEISQKDFHNEFKSELLPEYFLLNDTASDPGPDVKLIAENEEQINLVMIETTNLLELEEYKYNWNEIKILQPNNMEKFKSFETFQNAFSSCNHSTSEYLKKYHRVNSIKKDLSYKNKISLDLLSQSHSENVVLDDIIITVVIYKPLCVKDYSDSTYNRFKRLKPLQRIDMLGRHTLTDLANTITCMNNDSLLGDFSDNFLNWKEHQVFAKEFYKGWFFFIENYFYVSFEGDDLSMPIMQWIFKDNDRSREFGDIRRKPGDSVKLDELRVCIGKPYLFYHLGICEHIFIITDVKLVSKHQRQNPLDYPITTGTCKYQLIKCMICQLYNAVWLVTDCPITPIEKFPICTPCCDFLYNNGQRTEEAGNFKLFRLPSFLH